MKPDDQKVIREQIAPLLGRGELSLLLGAGFSIVNVGFQGNLPSGDGLRDLILAKLGKVPGPRTSLKDAYALGKRKIPDFNAFLSECFTVERVFPWQERIFNYAWSRIYTTNIDNVLNIACEQARRKGRLGGDFLFFNYSDPSVASEAIGSIPVVSIHGTCSQLKDGFIFSGLEYAKVAAKVLDWHRDLAAKSLTGGLLVVGNQLEESDLDVYVATRRQDYIDEARFKSNWIVLPDPDEIKAENYVAAGYHVIDATGKDFFEFLYSCIAPKTIGEIVIETVPVVKNAANRVRAMTWFRGAFFPVVTAVEKAMGEKGILRHFLTGSDPDWFYIVNEAQALTSRESDLTAKIGGMMQAGVEGVGILHVIGPSGSGKTTALRTALLNVSKTYKYTYEFNESGEIDTDLLREIISKFTEKSIFVFYSASEYYFAISYISKHFTGRQLPYCLFILEDRVSEYRKNKSQLRDVHDPAVFELSELSRDDALAIAEKIEMGGLIFDNFSEYTLDRRAGIIMDKEKGYGGDLLSALFSLTTHENFEKKIYQDYASVDDENAREILDIVAVINSQGFAVPVGYLAGMANKSIARIAECLGDDLAGVLIEKGGLVKCRHRIIADYYFKNCIAGHGSVDMILEVLVFLSRQFSVADIKNHPLPYRIYKELISFEFLYEQFLPRAHRRGDAERIYHEAQRLFGMDGIFWLQFGRYYRKVGKLGSAIDCFRTGLEFYESFQTKHSLGVTLLDLYMETGCHQPELYREGVDLLEGERIRRGSKDPYPTAALIDLLSRVAKANPDLRDARNRIKECLNYGIKYFSDDPYFSEQVKRFIKGVDY